jgi:Ca-activated chloride channel family protein
VSFLLEPFVHTSSGDFRFGMPYMLLALLAVPALFAWFSIRERRRTGTLHFPSVALIRRARGASGTARRTILVILRSLAIALLLIGMARPQFGRVERQTYSEGIDIILLVDVSMSMSADDFYPSRLEAAKEVIKEFAANRIGDRIGVVIFATDPLTLVPLTLDYGVVRNFIERIQFGIVDGNSTAIGMGLSTALKKLHDSTAKSKVVILLTDGENNAGKIDPLTAAEAAKTSKVRVYTIGVGTEMRRSGPFNLRREAGLDEATLKKIAETTGALYFHATDNQKLQNIYAQIDRLEKSRVESTQFDSFNDLVAYLAIPALLLLGFELLLRTTRFIKIP